MTTEELISCMTMTVLLIVKNSLVEGIELKRVQLLEQSMAGLRKEDLPLLHKMLEGVG